MTKSNKKTHDFRNWKTTPTTKKTKKEKNQNFKNHLAFIHVGASAQKTATATKKKKSALLLSYKAVANNNIAVKLNQKVSKAN